MADHPVTIINARCFLCENEPCQHCLTIENPLNDEVHKVTMCDTCFFISCKGEDQAVAHLYIGLLEATSKGYTDVSMCHNLTKTMTSVFHGFPAIGWVTWNNKHEDELEGPFLMAVTPLPTMPSLPPLWCRSRMPMFPALLRAAKSTMPDYIVPAGTEWFEGRYIVAPLPPERGLELAPEKNQDIVKAVYTAWSAIHGDRDPFTILANRMTNVGYELIRRMML